jgi:hypothetical protein
MGFRELVVDIDHVVFETLGDEGLIDGRRVVGMFSAPWLQPKVGRLNTGLREPCYVMRVSEAAGVEQGQTITIDLPALDGGGCYTIVRIEPDGTGQVALVLRIKP